MSSHEPGETDITLRLPPRPEILKNKPNPFYEKEKALITDGYTLPKGQLDKLFSRLSAPQTSKQVQLHEIYVEEIFHRGSLLTQQSNPILIERLYATAVSNHQKNIDTLKAKFLGPLSPQLVLPRNSIDDFVQRNYEQEMKKRVKPTRK